MKSSAYIASVTAAGVVILVCLAAVPAFTQQMMQPAPQQGYVPAPASPPAAPPANPGDAGNTLQLAPQSEPTPNPYYNAGAAIAGALNAFVNQQNQPPPLPPPPAAPPPTPSEQPPPSGLALQSQPVLPTVFRGCWQGVVENVDSITPLGAHKLGYWTPKTYRLCYRRVGGGPFQLTFSHTGIEPNEQIMNPQGQVIALATDGRDYAKMRSDLHFDEYARHATYEGETFQVDETTTLDCQIRRGDQMEVSARVYGTRDGEPWFKAQWHADFAPAPD
ncbi:MAG TPA: hypothetical protein VEJ86_02665 [Candidatus Binataceae bacterium]|nr:hypothetical protein [Candidatus Binataceae bacterium]